MESLQSKQWIRLSTLDLKILILAELSSKRFNDGFFTGVLLHYDDPLLKLGDCYFIHPEWLSQMMARVVTVREINPFVNELGVMKTMDVPLLFKGEIFPEAFIEKYLG